MKLRNKRFAIVFFISLGIGFAIGVWAIFLTYPYMAPAG